MATKEFTYQALDAAGKTVKGTIESDSAEHAAAVLTARRLMPLNVSAAGSGLQREIHIPGMGGRTKTKDLALFARQFASMNAAGLTLLRCLAILEEQTVKPKLKAAIGKVRADVQRGATLSAAMAQHPTQFPSLMVNMVKAGEAGGFLDEALARIATMYEADANLKAKIKAAMTYPIIVLCFSLIMGTGVIIFIVPVFEHLFQQFGGSLPLPTQILVDLSHSIWWWGPLLLIAIITTVVLWRRSYRSNPGFQLWVDKLKLRLPVFGSLFKKIAISRWSRNLATLLQVGVPALQALEVVGGTAGNAVIARAMDDVREAVRAGQPMSEPLSRHKIFPPMVVQMVEVGEETGRVTDMLEKTAEYYEQEVQTAASALTSAMEPLLVVLMGTVIGAMVISLYLPMFTIYGKIAQ